MLTIELPSQTEQVAFNERRWAELLADSSLAQFEGRVETDRHGQIIMSPPAAPRHNRFKNRIGSLLEKLLPDGEMMTECPISTADGVRAADVAWYTKAILSEVGNRVCFPRSPEICVEVRSPDNSEAQMMEKAELYFDAGAKEVWICDKYGAVQFFDGNVSRPIGASKLCPLFPTQIKLD